MSGAHGEPLFEGLTLPLTEGSPAVELQDGMVWITYPNGAQLIVAPSRFKALTGWLPEEGRTSEP